MVVVTVDLLFRKKCLHIFNHFLDGIRLGVQTGEEISLMLLFWQKVMITRSSWLNCALRDDEAVYWASIGHYEAVAVGN